MSEKTRGMVIGGAIIIIGIFALISNLHIVTFASELFWALIFTGGAIAFWSVYYRDKKQWWALIPAGFLIMIAITIILNIIPGVSSDIIGAIFLWGLGLAFISVYVIKHTHWWAIIPGGILTTLGFIVFINQIFWVHGEFQSFVLFFGIGLTFGFLYLIKNDENKLGWAKFPAAALILFSFFLLLVSDDTILSDILFPIGIIGLGLIIVINTIRRSSKKEK